MPFYAKNQLVWVKIKGYPWWPAIVAKSNQTRNGVIEDEVLVNFIGENSHAEVPLDKVADFEEHYEEYNVGKSKKLQDSIKIAMSILNGESTYEAERSRLQKGSRKRDQSEESVSEKADKDAKTSKPEPKKKEVERKVSPKQKATSPKSPKASPKVSRVNSKSKEEEKEKEKEAKPVRENSAELSDILLMHSITRARSKKEHIEMLTEPLIYNSRKNKGVTSKLTFKTLSKESIIKKNKAILSKKKSEASSSESEEDDDNKKSEKSKLVTKTLARKKEKETRYRRRSRSGSRSGSSSSVASSSRKGEEKKKKMMRKLKDNKEENEKEKGKESEKKKVKSGKESLKKSQKKESKNIDVDYELAKELEDIDDEEEYESFDLNIEAHNDDDDDNDEMGMEIEQKETKSNTSKRGRGENTVKSPIYTNKVTKEAAAIEEEKGKEMITKKTKKETMGAMMDKNEETKTVASYNSMKIKKFEKELENILNKLSTKFQRKEKSKDDEEAVVQLINLIKDLEDSSFTGSEYVNCELGKLFKTVQFLFILNKELLSKTEEILVLSLARILHKIKSKILQYCLDNTEYIDSLNLPAEHEGLLTPPTDVTPITIDDVRTKIEELNFATHHPVINMELHQSSIRTKMEEDMNMNVISKTPVRVPVKNEDNQVSPPAGQQGKKADAASSTNNFHLRKKICQKFAALLQKVYSMEKDKSQDLTLVIEDKINSVYMNSINEYKQAIKNLLKIIKANKLELEELVQSQDMDAGQFASLLKHKFRMLNDFLGSPENSTSGTDNGNKHKSSSQGLKEKEKAMKDVRAEVQQQTQIVQTTIITKVEEKYSATVKQEAEEATSSYQYIRFPHQNSF